MTASVSPLRNCCWCDSSMLKRKQVVYKTCALWEAMTVALVMVVLELEVLSFKGMNAFEWSKISIGSCYHFLFIIVLEWYIVSLLFKIFSNIGGLDNNL